MYSNVRGLKSKKASLTEILHEHDPQVFLITETQLRSNTGTTIQGYTFYSKIREHGLGGGVGIFVKNDIRNNTATHTTHRQIEILWISIKRKNFPPLFIGTYYGKQETRTSKDEIEKEMTLLQEEITEMKRDGEIYLAMDANAKIGLLNEPISRNGKLRLNVLKSTDLIIMNKSEKCIGSITRQNTKKRV